VLVHVCCWMLPVSATTGKMVNFYANKPEHRHCSANLVQNKVGFESLKQAPPLELTERYYQCVMTQYSSIFEALGLSIGNADLFVAVGTLMVLMFVSMWHRAQGFEDSMFAPPAKTDVSVVLCCAVLCCAAHVYVWLVS
jgi:hypothetical protein